MFLLVGGTTGYLTMSVITRRAKSSGYDDGTHYLRSRFGLYDDGEEWIAQRREGQLMCERCENDRRLSSLGDAIIVNVDENNTPKTNGEVSFDEPTQALCLQHIDELLEKEEAT